jgi:hypothetical protein
MSLTLVVVAGGFKPATIIKGTTSSMMAIPGAKERIELIIRNTIL